LFSAGGCTFTPHTPDAYREQRLPLYVGIYRPFVLPKMLKEEVRKGKRVCTLSTMRNPVKL